jgi:hypothetical protein
MLRTARLIPLLLLVALAAIPCPVAQDDDSAPGEPTRTKAWGLYGGMLQGAEPTNQALFGTRPDLDDAASFGGVFRVHASGPWDMEVRLGLSSTTFLMTPNNADPEFGPTEDVDATLYYLDVGLVPHWSWGSFTLGFPFGLGWAGTSADDVLAPRIPARGLDLRLTDGSGGQYFAGVQALFDAGDRWQISIDARMHRFHRLTNVIEQNASMPEFSVGFLHRFGGE